MKDLSEISIAVFINPLAGDGRFAAAQAGLLKYLNQHSISFVIFEKNWPIALPGCTHVFLVGGDGTVNFFVNEYPNCKTPISVFKAGTGNDFAWKLYGNRPLAEQIEMSINDNCHPVDAGICNGRLFMNGLGIGFDGAVVKDMKRSLKVFTGWLAYYYSVVRVINGYQSKQIQIHYPAGVRGTVINTNEKVFMITVANGSRFGGDFMVAPQALLNDGSLDLVVINAVQVWKRYRYLPAMKKGRHLSLPFVKTDKITSLQITASEPVAAHLDGELMIDDRFEINILPGRFNFRY